MTTRKTALIAGGGVAGLAAAVNLDERGYVVTLVEKKPILGGRTYSFADKITGAVIDNGQHLMVGAYHETLRLLERVGVKHKVAFQIPTVVPLINDTGVRSDFRLGQARPPFNLLKALLGFRGFTIGEKLSFLKLGRALDRLKKGNATLPGDLTVTQWLSQLGQSQRVRKEFWEVLTLATLNDSPNITSADGLVQVMLGSYFAGSRDGHLVFPQAGLSELFGNPVQRYLEMRGHSVQTGLGLREVRILNNEVQGFVLSDGELHKADLYVSALPFRPLLNALPPVLVESHSAIKPLTSFTSAPIISINLFYDRPVMKDEFIGSSSTTVHWFFNRDFIVQSSSPRRRGSSLDAHLDSRLRGNDAEKSLHHVIGVMSGAYDFLEADKETLVTLAQRDLERLCPAARGAKLVHSLVNKEREATLSSRPGVNAQRPEQRLLKNFYIIGDWTKTGLPATIESAAVSAGRVVE